MDPNVALANLRELCAEPEEHPNEIAEQFEALDTWLSQGGFRPTAWENFGGLKS